MQAYSQEGKKLLEENPQVQQIKAFAQSKFGGIWRFLFFCAGCCVVLAGTMNIMVGLGEFISPFDMIGKFIHLVSRTDSEDWLAMLQFA